MANNNLPADDYRRHNRYYDPGQVPYQRWPTTSDPPSPPPPHPQRQYGNEYYAPQQHYQHYYGQPPARYGPPPPQRQYGDDYYTPQLTRHYDQPLAGYSPLPQQRRYDDYYAPQHTQHYGRPPAGYGLPTQQYCGGSYTPLPPPAAPSGYAPLRNESAFNPPPPPQRPGESYLSRQIMAEYDARMAGNRREQEVQYRRRQNASPAPASPRQTATPDRGRQHHSPPRKNTSATKGKSAASPRAQERFGVTINKITRAPAKKREDPTPPPTRQQTQAATEASVTAQQAPSKPPTRPQAPKPNTGNTTPASYSKVIASVALTSPLHPTTDPRPASRISASGISRQQQCGPPRQLGGRQQRGGDSYRVRLPDISKADLFNIILADAPAGVPQSKQLPKPRFDIAEGLFDQYTAAIDNHDFQLRDLPIHGPITKDRLDEYIKGLVQEGMRKADIDRLEGEWMRKNGILIKCVYCIANKRVCSGSIPCTLSKAAQGRCPQGECYADLDCKVLACPFLHSTLTTMVKHGLQRAGLPVDMAYTIIARWMKRRSWNMPLKHYHKTFPRMRFETDYPPLGSAIEMSELRPDIGNVDSIPAHKAGQSASKWTLALIDDRSFDEWLQKQVEKANIALRHTQRKDTAHPPTWWFESSGAAAMFKSWDVLQAEMPEAYADVVAEFIVEYGEDMLIGPTIDTSSDVPLPSSTPRT